MYQYPLFKKYKQHITNTPKKFLKDKLGIDVNEDPEIQINDNSISQSTSKFLINNDNTNILLGIGGSGPTKRIPATTFLKIIEEISKIKNVNFFCDW